MRAALRSLNRSRWFLYSAVVCIGLGNWLALAATGTVRSVTRPDLPYGDASGILQIAESGLFGEVRGAPPEPPRLPFAHLAALRADPAFEFVAAYWYVAIGLVDDEITTRNAYIVSADLLPLLRVRPLLGRWFSRSEEIAGAGNVVVLGHRFWMRAFGGDSSVIGATLRSARGSLQIVGVLPEGFSFPAGMIPDMYVPTGADWAQPLPGATRALVRLRRDVSREQAHERAVVVALAHLDEDRRNEAAHWARLGQSRDLPRGPINITFSQYRSEALRDQTAQVLGGMLVAVTVLLVLVANANVATLVAVREAGRIRDIAVREWLGAGRWAIIRSRVVESAWLSLGGGLLGAALAFIQSRLITVNPDVLQLLTTGGWSAYPAILAGSTCAVTLASVASGAFVSHSFAGAIARPAGTSPARPETFMKRLVVLGVALTALLVGIAVTVLGSATEIIAKSPGYEAEDTYMVSVRTKLNSAEKASAAADHDLLTRLAAIPGIAIVAVGPTPTMPSTNQMTVTVRGRGSIDLGLGSVAKVSADYFRALGIPIVQGVPFETADSMRPRDLVVLSQSTANRIVGPSSPIGEVVQLEIDHNGNVRAYQVSAVVGDIRPPLTVGGRLPWAQVYLPEPDSALPRTSFVARVLPGHRLAGDAVESAVRVTPGRQLARIAAVRDLRSAGEFFQRSLASAFILFALAAMTMAVVGIFGTVAFAVERRKAELGLRAALGASAAQLLRLILLEYLNVIASGLGLGIAACLGVIALVGSTIYGIRFLGVSSYAFGSLVIAFAGMAASLSPALRAARSSPIAVLRHVD